VLTSRWGSTSGAFFGLVVIDVMSPREQATGFAGTSRNPRDIEPLGMFYRPKEKQRLEAALGGEGRSARRDCTSPVFFTAFSLLDSPPLCSRTA